MSTVDEAAGAPTPMGSDLQQGVDTLSLDQEIVFTRYNRLVLPLDGFVFWVRADLVGQSAMPNVARPNAIDINAGKIVGSPEPNAFPRIIAPAKTLIAKGSLHYATRTNQEESETFATNLMIFTSEQEIQDLNEVGPETIYIATNDAGVRFAFSERKSFYRQADLWHYTGHAVYSDMQTQIVDSPIGFSRALVVSNSLPAWLDMARRRPAYGFSVPFPVYPSFAVPANISPPFAAVHIDPVGTTAIGATQLIGPDSSLSQLASDRVRITMYGARNDQAQDFVAAVNQYSLDTDTIGIMNMPIVRDEKRMQPELGTLSMKKTVDFEVSYYQRRINDVARQLIAQAIPNFYIDGLAA